jgi:hypothetical protein
MRRVTLGAFQSTPRGAMKDKAASAAPLTPGNHEPLVWGGGGAAAVHGEGGGQHVSRTKNADWSPHRDDAKLN